MNCLLDPTDHAHSERADEPFRFVPCEFRVKWAATNWEREQALALRRAVFCTEQGIFLGDDRDAIDDHAQLIVALSCVGGAPDAVVGTVRIHEESPGCWWGSRLAVHAAFRHHGRIGATLIRLAVSSAHARGCREIGLVGHSGCVARVTLFLRTAIIADPGYRPGNDHLQSNLELGINHFIVPR